MVITFLTMYTKNLLFLQYTTWELKKYKSKYFTIRNLIEQNLK